MNMQRKVIIKLVFRKRRVTATFVPLIGDRICLQGTLQLFIRPGLRGTEASWVLPSSLSMALGKPRVALNEPLTIPGSRMLKLTFGSPRLPCS